MSLPVIHLYGLASDELDQSNFCSEIQEPKKLN